MQYIDYWPDPTELTLPEPVAQDLYRQLLEPFYSEGDGQGFWEETYSTVIILDPNDSTEDLHRDPAWNSIEFALTYPEYTVSLPNGYHLSVTIVNDSGCGIFLVT